MIERKLFLHLVGYLLAMLFLIGCTASGAAPAAPASDMPTATAVPPTETPIPPTAIPEPISLNPPARVYPAMAYDSESDKAILFGGFVSMGGSKLKDTWAYDYSANIWTELTSPAGPEARVVSAMTYDSESDRVILLGGANSDDEFLKDTWAYDYNANTWTEMMPPDSPQRAGHAMAYDAESDRVIMFGGQIDWVEIEGTWAYDYNTNTWTEMAPDISPPADALPQMAYDAESDRVILWGRETAMQNKGVWTYDYNSDSWEELEPGNEHPEAFSEGMMAYSVSADRIILHRNRDLWTYDYNTNTWGQLKLEPDLLPGLVSGHAMVYNPGTDSALIFGGLEQVEQQSTDKTWAFDLNTVTWTEVTPSE